MRNIIKHNDELQWTNERTHFLIKIYLSPFILEMVDVGCVGEVSWTVCCILTQSSSDHRSTSFSSWLGWAAQPWVTEGLSPQSGAGSHSGNLSPTGFNSNWNWPKPSVVPGYIIALRPPDSAVPPLIYAGASHNWWLVEDQYITPGLVLLPTLESQTCITIYKRHKTLRNLSFFFLLLCV